MLCSIPMLLCYWHLVSTLTLAWEVSALSQSIYSRTIPIDFPFRRRSAGLNLGKFPPLRQSYCYSQSQQPSQSEFHQIRLTPQSFIFHPRSYSRVETFSLGCCAKQNGISQSTSSTKKKQIPLLVSAIRKWCHDINYSIQRFIRYCFQKSTIYVLECDQGKFYVGSTLHQRQRMRQHFQRTTGSGGGGGGGSAWTREYPPQRIAQLYRRVPYRYRLGLESQVTAQYMWKCGVNNVRGAQYSQMRTLTRADLEGLVSFLGHYNNLRYDAVRQRLVKELPIDDDNEEMPAITNSTTTAARTTTMNHSRFHKSTVRRRQLSQAIDQVLCYQCGKKGHFAADCPERETKCFLCGEAGHFARNCPNQKKQ